MYVAAKLMLWKLLQFIENMHNFFIFMFSLFTVTICMYSLIAYKVSIT